MNEPDHAIETAGSTTWVEDGIVVVRAKATPSTHESVTELVGVLRELGGGTPRPLLFDARHWPGGDPAAWRVAIGSFEETCTRVAMLIDPESPAEVGRYPDIINRMLVPYEVFTDEAEAFAFLRGAGGSQPSERG